MARPITRDLLLDVLEHVPAPDPIVEFGSLQVEAEQDDDLRRILAPLGRTLTGTDMRPGPGVDRVEDLRALTYADGEVGTAVCFDTLEHCADPIRAVAELHRVLTPEGGVCVIASVMRFPIHGYPDDFFRFTPSGFSALLEPFDDQVVVGVGDPRFPQEVLGVGIRGGRLDGLDLRTTGRTAFHQLVHDRGAAGLKVGHEQIAPRDLARALAADLPRYVRARAGARRGRRASAS